MRAVVDTNVLLKGMAIPDEYTELKASAITWAEIRHGIGKARGEGDVVAAREFTGEYNALRMAWGTGLPFDDSCAASFEQVLELTYAAGRQARGRMLDLMIAATAIAHGADLITNNSKDFAGLESALNIVAVSDES